MILDILYYNLFQFHLFPSTILNCQSSVKKGVCLTYQRLLVTFGIMEFINQNKKTVSERFVFLNRDPI